MNLESFLNFRCLKICTDCMQSFLKLVAYANGSCAYLQAEPFPTLLCDQERDNCPLRCFGTDFTSLIACSPLRTVGSDQNYLALGLLSAIRQLLDNAELRVCATWMKGQINQRANRVRHG